MLPDTWVASYCIQLVTDAAASLGYGAIWGKEWFNGAWPEAWSGKNITLLELFLIV